MHVGPWRPSCGLDTGARTADAASERVTSVHGLIAFGPEASARFARFGAGATNRALSGADRAVRPALPAAPLSFFLAGRRAAAAGWGSRLPASAPAAACGATVAAAEAGAGPWPPAAPPDDSDVPPQPARGLSAARATAIRMYDGNGLLLGS